MKRMLPLLLLAILAGFVFLPSATQAWDDCPYGMVNDTYPGSCPHYVDTDGDGICDHSQLPPEEREDPAILPLPRKQLQKVPYP